MTGRVPVAGVWLPAGDVAEALAAYLTNRLLADRRRRSGAAFRSEPWSEAVRRLSAGAHVGAVSLPAGRLVGVNEFGGSVGRSPATVRRWCATGLLRGAHQVGGVWLIPVDAVPPFERTNDSDV